MIIYLWNVDFISSSLRILWLEGNSRPKMGIEAFGKRIWRTLENQRYYTMGNQAGIREELIKNMGIERVLLRVSSAIGSDRRRPAGETLIVPGSRPAIWAAIVYADIISSQGKLAQLVRLYTDKWAVMSNWTVYTVRCSPMMEKRITIRRVTDDQVEREHSTVKTKTRQSHDIYLSGLLNRMAFSFLSFLGGFDSLSIESFTRISSSPFPKTNVDVS